LRDEGDAEFTTDPNHAGTSADVPGLTTASVRPANRPVQSVVYEVVMSASV